MPKRIGLLVGDQAALTEAIRARCKRHPDIECQRVLIGVTGERHISRYDVIIDRLSSRVPHYRAFLRASVLAGVRVINDPLATSADDPFFALSLAARLGVNVPRTVLLPQKSYDFSIISNNSLQNLEFPLKWNVVGDYVHYPCLLRSAGRPARVRPRLVHSEGDLVAAFDQSGGDLVMAQQYFEGARAVRALCVAGEHVVLLTRGPSTPGRGLATDWSMVEAADGDGPAGPLPPPLRERIARDTRSLARALGYELCAAHFAVYEGRAYLVRAPDPEPQLDPERITPRAFAVVMDHVTDLAVALARGEPRPSSNHLWRQALAAAQADS